MGIDREIEYKKENDGSFCEDEIGEVERWAVAMRWVKDTCIILWLTQVYISNLTY